MAIAIVLNCLVYVFGALSFYHAEEPKLQLSNSFEILINMFVFLYVKANSKEICDEISFPSFFRKNAHVSIFVEIQG